jgi:hypothetical protein
VSRVHVPTLFEEPFSLTTKFLNPDIRATTGCFDVEHRIRAAIELVCEPESIEPGKDLVAIR